MGQEKKNNTAESCTSWHSQGFQFSRTWVLLIVYA